MKANLLFSHAKMQCIVNTNYQPVKAAFRGLSGKPHRELAKHYPPCAGKLVSRVPRHGYFQGLTRGRYAPIRRERFGTRSPYPSHGPELERWALPNAI